MNGSLFLFPDNPFLVPAGYRQLPELLRALGVAGDPLGSNSFLTGEQFSSHITFAGCSPYIVSKPPADGSRNFSHVSLHGPLEHVRLFTTRNRTRPRCTRCRERIADWEERLPQWLADPARTWCCPACGSTSSVAELDWRQYAAVGRLLLEIHNVFPGEAAPGDALMRAIQGTTDCNWRYGWANSSLD